MKKLPPRPSVWDKVLSVLDDVYGFLQFAKEQNPRHPQSLYQDYTERPYVDVT